jgi:hypothetical protein
LRVELVPTFTGVVTVGLSFSDITKAHSEEIADRGLTGRHRFRDALASEKPEAANTA